MTTYFTLASALETLSPGDRVFAIDLDSTGKKKFCVYPSEKNIKSLYEDARNNNGALHWYEVLLSGDRPTRLFLDVESRDHTKGQVIDAVTSFLALMSICTQQIGDGAVDTYGWLDSSRKGKASFHVIGNIYFSSVADVGAVVRQCWCAVQDILCGKLECPKCVVKDDLKFLTEKNGECIVDCIYTRNRVFRLPYSSKFGSPHILVPFDALPKRDSWYDYMVQSNKSESTISVLEIDGSAPGYTNKSFRDALIRPNDEIGWVLKDVRRSEACDLASCSNPFIAPVLQRLNDMGFDLKSETLRYSPSRRGWLVSTNSKRCGIARREHKSNHVWFLLTLGSVKQYCYDTDCRGCVDVNVGDAWSLWNNSWHTMINATEMLNSVETQPRSAV